MKLSDEGVKEDTRNMCTDRKFNVNIFVAEGRPDGLRLVTKTGWNGIGIIFTRSNYIEARKREELKQCGVYVLLIK